MSKENKTQKLVEALQEVAAKKYSVGDEVKAYGKDCKIVEILGEGRFHCKNLVEPFDSFVVLSAEFE